MKKIISWEDIVENLPILLGVVTLLLILVSYEGALEEKWSLLVFSLIGFYVAYGGLRGVRKQIKIATRRNDLDRHMGSVKLLCREEMMSQLGGVHGLRELLEPGSDGGKWIVKEARISLETFLKENWDLDIVVKLEEKEEKIRINLRKKVRDAVLNALFSTYRKGERALDFSFLDLRLANLSRANLVDANLRGANLVGANLSRANSSRADLSRANLKDTDLSCTDLRNADLRGVNLDGANLVGADLRGVNLSYANLGCANLRGVNLSCADLSCADFKEARGLDEIGSYNGILAYRGKEPTGLSDKPERFLEELGKNLK